MVELDRILDEMVRKSRVCIYGMQTYYDVGLRDPELKEREFREGLRFATEGLPELRWALLRMVHEER